MCGGVGAALSIAATSGVGVWQLSEAGEKFEVLERSRKKLKRLDSVPY